MSDYEAQRALDQAIAQATSDFMLMSSALKEDEKLCSGKKVFISKIHLGQSVGSAQSWRYCVVWW